MPSHVLLHLISGHSVRLEVDLKDWTTNFEEGLRENNVVYVNDRDDARMVAINPNAVTYWKHCC